MDKDEIGRIAVDYLNEHGCVPMKVAKSDFFDRMEIYAADSRYSSEAIGIFVRNFFGELNAK